MHVQKVLVDRTHAGLLLHIAPPTLLGHAAAGIPARRDLARQLGDGVTATHAVGREAPRPRRCTAYCHNSALPTTLCASHNSSTMHTHAHIMRDTRDARARDAASPVAERARRARQHARARHKVATPRRPRSRIAKPRAQKFVSRGFARRLGTAMRSYPARPSPLTTRPARVPEAFHANASGARPRTAFHAEAPRQLPVRPRVQPAWQQTRAAGDKAEAPHRLGPAPTPRHSGPRPGGDGAEPTVDPPRT